VALWCIKGGRYGEQEQAILDNAVVGIGWRKWTTSARPGR